MEKKSQSGFEPITLVCKSNALTIRPSGRLYSSTELDRVGFCELQQRSDVY
jgi:hypothetical protein